jgi:hypothetical protein
MIKVLQAIADQRFQGSHSPRPTKKVLDMIVTCSRGDVRGAIMELQLSSLASKPTKKGKSNGSNDSVALLKLASQREQSMALFHLIGKVLYNKRMSLLVWSLGTVMYVHRQGRPTEFFGNEAGQGTAPIARTKHSEPRETSVSPEATQP